MNPILQFAFKKLVRSGDLTIVDPEGKPHRFGDGAGKPVKVRFTTKRAEWACVRDVQMHLGEAYMNGTFRVEDGSLYDFLDVSLSNLGPGAYPRALSFLSGFRYLTRRIAQYNPVSRARKNVAHHYDLDAGLYDLFLDEDRQYSCGFFEHENATLEEAQFAKKRHIVSKLDLKDGHRVLDIGSGWGGLSLFMAKAARIKVTGITLSTEQHKMSEERTQREGLAKAVDFKLLDYRQLKGTFDRIVSVGMFEHVGVTHYNTFFRKVRSLLSDDGAMVLHSIGRFDGPGTTNSWIAKYIFPGGYIPALSEVVPAIERAGLKITDIEVLRLHYAETLREWRKRFMSNWDKAQALYDERFCRMWEFYLAASETAFRYQDMMVFQVQIAKDQNALPLTRDYMFEREQGMRGHDSRSQSQKMAGE